MRVLFAVLAAALSASALLHADATIRYKTEISSPILPAVNRSDTGITYMKGNRGVSIMANQTTIVDFGRQEVTLIDTARGKYATIPASEYGKRVGDSMMTSMPNVPGVAGMLKLMKTVCETKNAAAPEIIQGVQSEERDVTCTTTIPMPANMANAMPDVGTKMTMRIWSASESERLRVPGLWQLSGFELWEKYFMNPAASMSKIVPGGMSEMFDAIGDRQSATMRLTSEMTMKIPMPGMPAAQTPFFRMNMEVVGISTELLDDSLFSVPGGYSAEPFEVLMRAMTDAAMESAKGAMATGPAMMSPAALANAPHVAIPPRVKAYVPDLAPLTQTEPSSQLDAKGNKAGGSVTILLIVGPRGLVQEAEALSGPEDLRKAAADAVRRWTFRPVIRNGNPVPAYTNADVIFQGEPKTVVLPDLFSAEATAAEERLSQLEEAFPRSPEQELADMEQDAAGGDKSRRYYKLADMATTAAAIKANDKAKAYASELLAFANSETKDWYYGNALHAGHIALGLVALNGGDMLTARAELLEAGRTPGSPQLDSFGPNMTLARELLKKGERDTVLQYLELTRKFWKSGGAPLDSMMEAVRQRGTLE